MRRKSQFWIAACGAFVYAWFLILRNGRIVEAVAFFDSIAFD